MSIPKISPTLLTTVSALAVIVVLASYNWLQAKTIKALSHSVQTQQATINLLRQMRPHSLHPTTPLSDKKLSKTPFSEATTEQHPIPLATRSHPSQPTQERYPFYEQTSDTIPNTSEIRIALNALLETNHLNHISDAAFINEASDMLAEQVQDSSVDFKTSLTYAYALHEVSGSTIPVTLSQTLLEKAEQSNSEDDLLEALIFITEQKYAESIPLANDLINSSNPDARMVGLYLLANDHDSQLAAPTLANHLYTYPDESIQMLRELLTE